MSDLEILKLGDVCTFKTGKLNSNAAIENGAFPFYTCAQTIYRTNTYSFDTECVILGGNNAEARYPIFYKNGKFDAYQRNYIIEPKDNSIINVRWLYYALSTYLEYMRLASTGATTRFLTLTILKNIKLNVPSINTQIKIADTLSTYENLIENNNRRIQILEQTAEELYKEWFVRMRFPGYEKTKFHKGIPEGWEVKKVKELVKRYRYGSLYKENDVMQEGNVIVIDQSEKDFLGFHNNEPDHFARIDNPIILFGDHSCKMLIMTSPFSLSENVIPFNAENNLNTLFLFYAVKGLVHTTEYKRHWSDLTNKRILVPDYSLQQNFEAKVKSIIILINKYKESNLNLIKQRDLLLPRLMNGTITVK